MKLPGRAPAVALAVAFAIFFYAFPYFGALKHANELPRVLTAQELVHRGTFRLGARMGELGSRADISTTPDGRQYQNKAPGMAILGAVVYAPLAAVVRVFGGPGATPSLRVTTWLLRAVMVMLPAVAFLVVFRRVAARFALRGVDGESLVARDVSLIAYGLGSLAFPYSLLFMSHVPAAIATGGAFALAIMLARGEVRPTDRAALGVGLLLGLAMFVEYQAIFAAAFVSLYSIARAPARRLRTILALGLGAAPFIGALAWYHAACFGSPLRTGYAYSVDEANRVGFWGIVGPSWKAAGQLFTLGNNGLLVLSPWVLLSLVGAIAVARDKEKRALVGAEALVAVLVVASYLLFVVSLEPEFGRAGWSIGPRYIAVAMPFFAWLSAAGLAAIDDYDELRVPVLATVFASVLVNVLAATTYPHWPTQLLNPVFEVSLRLLREGRAPHSLGTLVGLRGVLSLAPLYVLIIAVVGIVLRRTGVSWRHLGIAAALAALALSRFENFAKTPENVREPMWRYITSTYEP